MNKTAFVVLCIVTGQIQAFIIFTPAPFWVLFVFTLLSTAALFIAAKKLK